MALVFEPEAAAAAEAERVAEEERAAEERAVEARVAAERAAVEERSFCEFTGEEKGVGEVGAVVSTSRRGLGAVVSAPRLARIASNRAAEVWAAAEEEAEAEAAGSTASASASAAGAPKEAAAAAEAVAAADATGADAAAAADARFDETVVVDETAVVDETLVVDETVMGADAAAAADAKLEALATGLTSFPTELSSAQQAMAARGGLNDPLPFLPRHGATAAEAVTLLRGVWTRVLELSIAEVESLDDDATPFGSLGTLNGLELPLSASNCL